MLNDRNLAPSAPEAISALMDGQLRGEAFGHAMQSMGQSESLACWHTYHVIGDVLRSSELAQCHADAAFLHSFRARLAAEPGAHTALAVEPSVALPQVARDRAANDGVFRWKAVAGLASFAAVAAIGWNVWSTLAPSAPGTELAVARPPAALALVSSRQAGGVPAVTPVGAAAAAPTMLRDPQLDELLAAHRQATGASAFGDTSAFLRNATFEAPER